MCSVICSWSPLQSQNKGIGDSLQTNMSEKLLMLENVWFTPTHIKKATKNSDNKTATVYQLSWLVNHNLQKY